MGDSSTNSRFLETQLKNCRCEHYIHVFQDHDIDDKTFPLLQRKNVLHMIPEIKEGELIRIVATAETLRLRSQLLNKPTTLTVGNPATDSSSSCPVVSQTDVVGAIKSGGLYHIQSCLDGCFLQPGPQYTAQRNLKLTSIETAPNSGSRIQKWKLTAQGKGYQIENLEHPGSCLQVASTSILYRNTKRMELVCPRNGESFPQINKLSISERETCKCGSVLSGQI